MKTIAIAFLISAAAAANAQQLTELGSLGGTNTRARWLSEDGSVAVGFSNNSSNLSRAFRWTRSGGMTDLGTLGGSTSIAYGVSNDGAIVVGTSTNGSNVSRAFRWTNAGGMTDIGTLGGNTAEAYRISGDGSTIVGISETGIGRINAFKWTNSGMINLGTLGGNYSQANGVSFDGSTIVGITQNILNESRAFLWTNSGLVDLGTLGGTYSTATAVSADGGTVVGSSFNASGTLKAFRWTSIGGMVDIGTLGGTTARANAISADGSVVVGRSSLSSGEARAFRWTSVDGLTNLGTLGGNSSEANAISADGEVIAGHSLDASGAVKAFIHYNRVMLDVQEWLGSVAGVNSMLSTSLELTRTFMEGAHHRPLAELGRGKSYWVTGDVASSSRSRDLITRSGEAGVTFEPWTNVLVGVGAGYGRQDQQLANDGSASTFGQYLVGELDFLLADGGVLSLLVSSGDWQNETDRGYMTGSGVDYSHGETDIKSSSFRVRYDTPTLTNAFGADIKAYGSYGHLRSRADAYVETGGSYAGSFSEMEQTAKEGRLGLAATRKLGEKLRGRLSAEWIHRFDREQASITATDITSTLDLTLPGAAVQRNQARFGFDLDYLMDAKTTLSFTVHAAGRGEIADVSGAVSLRKAF
jgi:probable HAF family extracellular repeat protein